jgi:four helix bundle protein
MVGEDQLAYKDLKVWQKGMDLVDQVINVIDEIETHRKHYRLIEQLESAATSIPLNIAEGKGRISRKEFVHFLYIARGSAYETLTLLEVFRRQNWLSEENFQALEISTTEIIKMLKGLIKAISQN